MSKKLLIKELLKLFEPTQKGCRMVIPEGKFYTDLVETKPIEAWQKEYKTIIVAKPDMHGLIYLWNFDVKSEALHLMSRTELEEKEDKRLDKLLSETISPAN